MGCLRGVKRQGRSRSQLISDFRFCVCNGTKMAATQKKKSGESEAGSTTPPPANTLPFSTPNALFGRTEVKTVDWNRSFFSPQLRPHNLEVQVLPLRHVRVLLAAGLSPGLMKRPAVVSTLTLTSMTKRWIFCCSNSHNKQGKREKRQKDRTSCSCQRPSQSPITAR